MASNIRPRRTEFLAACLFAAKSIENHSAAWSKVAAAYLLESSGHDRSGGEAALTALRNEDWQSSYFLGDIHASKGKVNDALESYTIAIIQRPENPFPILNAGNTILTIAVNSKVRTTFAKLI
jgi:hypothetical protein